ncbi:MAG: D-hexose-6-phosphate mutarotase [Gammaproteobacteria bacterium]|nr:D-hexose-6-phosphate mutarotase [Gammaproteobacteria bacterium]
MQSLDKQTLLDAHKKLKHVEGIEVVKYNQLLALRVDNESASATIFLQGAQVASYQPKGQKPVIWLSDSCDYESGSPLRGGIPICWPWFGDLSKNPQAIIDQLGDLGGSSDSSEAPAHGLVRSRLWSIDSAERVDADTTSISFCLDVGAGDPGIWQYPCRLTLVVTVGVKLDVSLGIENVGASGFMASCALHSYFYISNIASATVSGLHGVDYVDSLQDWRRFTQDGCLVIKEEVDRIYQSIPGQVVINDAGLSRNIYLTQRDAPSLVVWNPWLEKAKRLSCFGAKDYLGMLCLETAQVLEHARYVGAGDSYSIGVEIESVSEQRK